MAQKQSASGDAPDSETVVSPTTLDASSFEAGDLYWFRVSTDDLSGLDSDPSVRYRPRVVEEVQEDRIRFDTGYYALSDEAASHSGRRFKVTDDGFSYGTVLSFYEGNIVPGAVLRVTSNGQTRTVRVLDTLYGTGERYYVRDEDSDSLYFLNGTDGTLSASGRGVGRRDGYTYEVESVELLEQGEQVHGTDEPNRVERFDLVRTGRGQTPLVVLGERGFPVARDENAYGFDVSEAVEIADDALDGRKTSNKNEGGIQVEFDPVTDELLTLSPSTRKLSPSREAEEVAEAFRDALYAAGMEPPRDPFES